MVFPSRFIVVLVTTLSVGLGASVSGRAEIAHSVDTIIELAEELEDQGKRLCIVRMPVRDEMYGAATDAFDAPLDELHPNTVSGTGAEELLEEAGVPVINLYPDIRRESLLSNIFMQDRFHFTEEAEERIAAILTGKLQREEIMMRKGQPQTVVFMGECFAESFARKIIAADPEDEIKILNKNGGGYLVHNYLFVFSDDYLDGTDVVVWIFTDRHFRDPRFASLNSEPAVPDDVEPRTVVAMVESTFTVKAGDEKKLDYPDALRANTFTIEGSGERVVGIDQILKNRQLTANRKYREGQRLRLKLVPWNAWLLENREMARVYLIDDVDDLTMPRYWIEGWLPETGDPVTQETLTRADDDDVAE